MSTPWGFIRNIQWIPDGRSFLADGVDLSGRSTTPQIWRVTYPSGERSRITNDLNAYFGVSVSGDGESIATVQAETRAGIQTASLRGGPWTRVTVATGRADGVAGLAWMPDGHIVFTAAISGLPQLWIADPDGHNERQIVATPGPASLPSASPDGRWIYFQSMCKEGVCVYRVAPDGSGLQQLTHGGDESAPVISPDGRVIYVTERRSGKTIAAKVPADGGDAVAISPESFAPVAISPDGTRLAGQIWNAAAQVPAMGLLPVGGGAVDMFAPRGANAGRFSPDGRSWIYADFSAVPTRLMVQPLAGGEPRPLDLVLPTGSVFGGDISRDGRIALSVGGQTSDVVLISAAPAQKR
jgi:dipeptidyl aminopeptidase/acylaminoacyl peptidase